ncbi:hypothetical protein [Streptomyces sp. NPDC001978]|uniref:hypothetical protein n=1 Tax=Streptomyces sp. NPDC001978 TaxID=3364627 RepID=UPI003678AB0D
MTSRRRKEFMREAAQRQADRERAQREAEEQARQPGEDYLAFLRRMDEVKYKRPNHLPPASMSDNSDRLPLFWLAYFVIPIVGTWLLIHFLDWWNR